MDCYFHNAVPSVSTCRDCARTVCATCRALDGSCPSCRLAARIDAAQSAGSEALSGGIGPASPPRGPRATPQPQPQPQAAASMPYAPALCAEPVSSRALVALGYPLWPLAALALLAPKRSRWLRRQAMQGLGFNLGTAALWTALAIVAHVPFFGMSAWPVMLVFWPVWFVASVVYMVKAWQGEDVRVPLVSEMLDERELEAAARSTA